MSERDDKKTPGESGRVLRCDEWEDLIADALDGTLPPAAMAAFTRHCTECALCAQMWKETQQGRAWMEYLTAEPVVPADLLQRILVRTTEGLVAGDPAGVDGGIEPGVAGPSRAVPSRPVWHRVAFPHVRQAARQILEPRLMMTIAMAFFSIALTLNLTGINLAQLRPSDLQPSHLRATLTRQYYSTNEQVTKYYENLRLVYEMEARVRELRRSTEAQPAAAPSPQQAPRQPVRDGSGSPSSKVPKGDLPVPGNSHLKGDAVEPPMTVQAVPQRLYAPQAGPNAKAQASYQDRPTQERPAQVPASFARNHRGAKRSEEKVVREVFRALRSMTEDQAKRSLV